MDTDLTDGNRRAPPERLGARLTSRAAPCATTGSGASDTQSSQPYGVHAGAAPGQGRPRATRGRACPHARLSAGNSAMRPSPSWRVCFTGRCPLYEERSTAEGGLLLYVGIGGRMLGDREGAVGGHLD